MKAVQINAYGGTEVLELADRPAPTAGPGQLVVRVEAATVNPVDIATREGWMAPAFGEVALPAVPGWDLVGTVLSGDGFAVGTRVAAMLPWYVRHDGAYAEQVLVDTAWAAAVPAGLDPIEAATIPLNGLTAAQALALLDLPAGASLLVTGASGGVGGFAVELAARAGLRVLALASTGDEEHVRALGADDVLPRGTDLSTLAVDGVLDAAELVAPALAATRDGGRFLAVTDPSIPEAERGITVLKVGVVGDGPGLATLLAAGLTTRVAETLPLADAAKAMDVASTPGVRGKVVLLP